MFSSKKGNVVDILVVSLIVFLGAFTLIVTQYTNTMILSGLQTSTTMNTSAMEQSVDAVYLLDFAIVGLYVTSILFSVISAYYIGSHPFFFMFSVLFMLVVNVVMAMMSNTFQSVMEGSTGLGLIANNFPWTVNIVHYLPMYAFLSFCVIAIALYAGKRNEGL